jgi:7-cyano-7-deazaguanine synthase
MEGDKFTILQDGEKLCEELGLDFNEVYSRTNTSYKPIKLLVDSSNIVKTGIGTFYQPKFEWYSDYKSASSVERVEAFIKLGRKDPVAYADPELGPVTWEHVVEQVSKVLEEHNK